MITRRFKPDARLFEFDGVSRPDAPGNRLPRQHEPAVEATVGGRELFYIAYGGSQTGKSYSFEGTRFRQPNVGTTRAPSNPRGCVGRFLKDLFVEIRNKRAANSYTKKHVKQKLDVRLEYLELYQGNVYDCRWWTKMEASTRPTLKEKITVKDRCIRASR